jgi:hypothetical protein
MSAVVLVRCNNMGWKTITDFLVYRTWWAYGPDPSWVEVALHAFNLLEGSVWLVLSGLVLRRFFRHRHSPIEVMYALAFFTFGLTTSGKLTDSRRG